MDSQSKPIFSLTGNLQEIMDCQWLGERCSFLGVVSEWLQPNLLFLLLAVTFTTHNDSLSLEERPAEERL